jgi:hypothetical protein
MSQEHPITPPPELVDQWREQAPRCRDGGIAREDWLMIRAAQWGADQELEACCAFAQDQTWALVNGPHVADVIRAARRSKPSSLKELALEMLGNAWEGGHINNNAAQTIRRALEQLHD